MASTQHEPLVVAGNSIAKLQVPGHDSSGANVTFTFTRNQGLLRSALLLKADYDGRADRPYQTQHPAPKMFGPGPGQSETPHLNVRLKLGGYLRRNAKCDAEWFKVSLAHDNPETSRALDALPKLMAKVSNRGKARRVAYDAYMYERMCADQGVYLPRCYGYFVAEIPSSQGLAIGKVTRPFRSKWQKEYRNIPAGAYMDSDSDADDRGFEEGEQCMAWSRGPPESHPYRYTSHTISILLLERCQYWDPYLLHRIPYTPKSEEDMASVYAHLWHHYIRPVTNDSTKATVQFVCLWRPMRTADRICADHGTQHEWLLADFEGCVLADHTHVTVEDEVDGWMADAWSYELELWRETGQLLPGVENPVKDPAFEKDARAEDSGLDEEGTDEESGEEGDEESEQEGDEEEGDEPGEGNAGRRGVSG